MKKFLAFAIVAVMFGFNTVAYAAGTDGSTSVEAGITPDSILYSADRLAEDLKLLFTFDSQKDAELLLQFANERLAEAKVMTEEEKTQFVETAVKDYTELMNKAEETIAEVAADESTTNEVKEELAQELEATAQVDEAIQNELGEEQQQQLEEKTAEVSYTANVVKNLDVTVVQALREKGMGFGQIAHTIALSEISGKTVDEITAMLESGKGIGEIAKELEVHPSKINSKKADTVNTEEPAETEPSEETTPASDSTSASESTSDNTAVTTAAQVTATESTASTVQKKVEKKTEAVTAQPKKSNDNTTITNESKGNGNSSNGKTADSTKNDKSSKGKK